MNKLLVLIHGWGINRGVWQPLRQKLPPHYETLALDLPGYAQTKVLPDQQADTNDMAQILMEQIPKNKKVVLAGWSLGGLLAAQMAQHLPHLDHLLLLTSNPRFVQDSDWPCAVSSRLFEDFSRQLLVNTQKTQQRFIAIQAMGSTSARKDAKTIRKITDKLGQTDPKALTQGLQILLSTDQRKLWQQLGAISSYRITLILGQRDTLVPQQLAFCMRNLWQDVHKNRIRIIPGASHAPFISHPKEIIPIIQEVMDAP